MKRYADADRREEHFNVGQWVYVKLRPGRQSSLAGHLHHPKLSRRFFGPFLITERIGEVAYRLQLPPESHIHPVFHSSLLRPHCGPSPTSTASCPLQFRDQQPLRRPLCFLDSRLDNTTTPPTRWVLTQWEGEPLEDTSWESWTALCQDYHLEDKVEFWGGGIVSTSQSPLPRATTSSDQSSSSPPRTTTRPTRTSKPPPYLRDYDRST
ncbi:uncharacterized protein [Glycine max]|uniref:uncharacterized protein n=1 Tax=Glycine max TaxID=3847 RepID=UPI000E21B42E|nr:uncharacterized protein LOC112999383 [Glycine max]|eukprot:XP_025981316.1 uncharacterized protein LOC112999383 [Glycine max]